MATIYNLTNVTNSTNIADAMVQLNQVTGYLPGTVTLFTMYIITFFALKGWSNVDAFGASSFGFAIMAVLFFFAELIGETVLWFFITLGVVGMVVLVLKK